MKRIKYLERDKNLEVVTLRWPKKLKRKAERDASKKGVSLNRWVETLIHQRVDHR
jgi:predicted HicB family RNase H-like nuclease